VHGKLGMVAHMMRTMGSSPAVLNAYLSFAGAWARAACRPSWASSWP
jgi:hypothetical protein